MLKTDSEIHQAAEQQGYGYYDLPAYTAGYNQAKADAIQTTEPAAAYVVTMVAEAVPGGMMVEPVDMREQMEQLADDYERQRNTLTGMLDRDEHLPYDRERLKGKLEMCNNFLTEIGRILG